TLKTEPVSVVVKKLVEDLRPAAKALDCSDYLEHCVEMAQGPSWADRQLAIFEETGDAREIVRRLTDKSRVSEQAPAQ
ncbi:unnamed protein product, partial [marine sediment metagenome]